MKTLVTSSAMLSVALLSVTPAAQAKNKNLDIQTILQRLDVLEARIGSQAHLIKHQKKIIKKQQLLLGGIRGELKTLKALPKEEKKGAVDGLDRFKVNLGLTSILQRSSGVKPSLASTGDAGHATATLDLEMETAWEDGSFAFVHFESGDGAGLDATLPTLSGLNGDAAPGNNLLLTEMVLGREFKGWTLQTGRLDPTAIFDSNAVANDETANFLNGALINNLAVEFPDRTIGAAASIGLGEKAELHIGLFDNDSDWDNVFEDAFAIAEVDFHTNWGGQKGNYGIYTWQNGADHTDLQNAAKTQEKNWGVGLSFDQTLANRWTFFTRYGAQRASVSDVHKTFSAGFSLANVLGKGKGGEFGLGYVRAMISHGKQLADAATNIQTSDETVVEGYLRFSLTDYLNLTPNIQWIQNPNANQANDSIWTFGIRTQLNF